MRILRLILIVLAFVVLAAHFSRAGNDWLAVLALVAPHLLLLRKPWAGWTLRVALLLGGFEWIRTTVRLVGQRRAEGDDWTRLAIILVAVAILTFAAAWAVRIRSAGDRPASAA